MDNISHKVLKVLYSLKGPCHFSGVGMS
uniref:Uncharacterized protein n=1 Tax=Rhizophora mucronata TaxID=61149 RepID=A0A2P2QEY1_RHIMU